MIRSSYLHSRHEPITILNQLFFRSTTEIYSILITQFILISVSSIFIFPFSDCSGPQTNSGLIGSKFPQDLRSSRGLSHVYLIRSPGSYPWSGVKTKHEKKNISAAVSSQQISGKYSESK